MSFSLQRYFSNLFVAIVVEANVCKLLGKVVKNREVIKTFQTVFDNPDEENIDSKVIKYLQSKEKEYNNVYTALYLDSIGQGAINGVSVKEFEKYSVDIKNINYVHVENLWSAYASYIDVKWAKGMFEPLSLDLLYSPFLLLFECIKKQETLPTAPILYIYSHEDSFAIGVFRETHLLFGAFFKITTDKDELLDDMSDIEDWEEAKEEIGIENLKEIDTFEDNKRGINLETVDELTDMEDLEDLEDLDDLEENFDIDEEHEAFEEEYNAHVDEQQAYDPASSIELFGKDMKMYRYLTSSIKEFYQDPIYEHVFIEKIIVFDNHKISDGIKSMIESELFMEVSTHQVDTLDILCDLAIKDVPL